MKQFFIKIQGAFDTQAGNGFSARKLSAFVIIVCILASHFSWLKHAYTKEDYTLLTEVLFIDYGFIAALLGMTTYEGITRKKLETKTENENNENKVS